MSRLRSLLLPTLVLLAVLQGPDRIHAWGTVTVTTSCASGCGTTDDYNGTATMTVAISAASGDLIVVGTVHWRATPRTLSSADCTDSLTASPGAQLHTQGSRLWTFATIATASRTSCQVTLSGTSTVGGDMLWAMVVSGPTDPLTETGTSTGSSTTGDGDNDAAAVTPGAAPVLFAGFTSCAPVSTVTIDADFTSTVIGGTPNSGFGYIIQADTTAQAMDNGTSGAAEPCETSLVAIQGVAASSTCNGGLLTLGAGKACE